MNLYLRIRGDTIVFLRELTEFVWYIGREFADPVFMSSLSVVKWIHLNNGDEGLVEFFTRVFTTLHPNGRFILEAQPWESYQKAARLSTELKESYEKLTIRPDEFERILLEDIGFTSVEKLLDDSGKGFKRPLHVYRRAAGSWL